MRALVTGANGFVGRYLTAHLLDSGDEVLACDQHVYENAPCAFKQLDVADGQRCAEIVTEFQPDVIYHLAGIAFLPQAEDDFKAALMANVLGTNNIYRVCHLLERGTRIVYISSAEVYGRVEPRSLPVRENHPVQPANNYSLSKAMGELVAMRYNDRGQVPGAIMRPFNHIGAGQNERFVCSNFAMQLARIARGIVPPIIHVGNLEARRDFSDVRDVVRAYRLAGTKGSGVYNIGSGRALPIKEILAALIDISGVKVDIKEDPARMRAAEVPEVYTSYAKAQSEFGWTPQIPIEETLKSLYGWWSGRV